MSDKYICGACQVNEPWEHRCLDRVKCQCAHCKIVELQQRISKLEVDKKMILDFCKSKSHEYRNYLTMSGVADEIIFFIEALEEK